MNSSISHRLYVAAVGNEGPPQVKSAPDQSQFANLAGIASAIPLELLEPGKSMPEPGARPLRASSQQSKS